MKFTACLFGALVLFGAGGCAVWERGPWAPENLAGEQARDEYNALARGYLAEDEAFAYERLASALIVKALYFAPELARAGAARWAKVASYVEGTSGWGGRITFLMAIFREDFRDEDVLKNGRFRPFLKTADGRELAPAAIKGYGRQDKFVGDFFPVFSPWDQVFLVQFDAAGAAPEAFLLKWPGGTQSLPVGLHAR